MYIYTDPLSPWLQEPGSQELGTFLSRICDFRVCLRKNVLCPAAQMRRLRRPWASAEGDTATHAWVLDAGLLHLCAPFTVQLHPTHSYTSTAPDPLVCGGSAAAAFCDVRKPGRLRRFFSLLTKLSGLCVPCCPAKCYKWEPAHPRVNMEIHDNCSTLCSARPPICPSAAQAAKSFSIKDS